MKTLLALLMAVLLALPLPSSANAASNRLTPALKSYLQKITYDPYSTKEDIASTQVTVNEVRLKDGRGLIFAFLEGPMWCGSGGCNLLILERVGSSFRELGDISVMYPPVRVLTAYSHGRPDISVQIKGAVARNGGYIPNVEMRLKFNGHHYPGNPTGWPALKVKMGIKGRTVIQDRGHGQKLYP